MITLRAGAAEAIRSELAAYGDKGVLRIDLVSSGCCDPIIGLCWDQLRAEDLMEEVEGIRFAMGRGLYALIGDVTISFVDDGERRGFLISATRAASEWDGFGLTTIMVPSNPTDNGV